jgi:hypothetical protein
MKAGVGRSGHPCCESNTSKMLTGLICKTVLTEHTRHTAAWWLFAATVCCIFGGANGRTQASVQAHLY